MGLRRLLVEHGFIGEATIIFFLMRRSDQDFVATLRLISVEEIQKLP
jgi:hypothetical protein